MKILKLLIVISFLFISGCANVAKMQGECEQTYTKFFDIYTCTKSKLASDVRMKKNPKVKLYILKGERLVQEIEQGTITEIDAKVAWQKLYVDLKHNEVLEGAAIESAKKKNYPTTTNCTKSGNSVQCNSY